jgi:transposase
VRIIGRRQGLRSDSGFNRPQCLGIDCRSLAPGVVPAGPAGRVSIGALPFTHRHNSDHRPGPAFPCSPLMFLKDGMSHTAVIAADASDRGPAQVVLGVDTHKDLHVAAVLTVTGVLLSHKAFPTTATGYDDMVAWARSFGVVDRAGVEGTGSYGAALARHLARRGITVVEVNRPDRAMRRRQGKTDAIDAEAAGLAVLSGRATAAPKSGTGSVEMIRMFKIAKDSAVKARTQALNQLKAVLVMAEAGLREQFAMLSTPRLIKACAGLEEAVVATPADAARHTLRLLANRIRQLSAEVNELTTRIAASIEATNSVLLERRGVEPDSAAVLLITAGDNADRLTSEASFAVLCGVSPVEATTGKTNRRRLSRGGNRQANAALYRITLSRLRWDTRTQEYLARRMGEGKTRREAIRCLKRYIAREIYGLLVPRLGDRPAVT